MVAEKPKVEVLIEGLAAKIRQHADVIFQSKETVDIRLTRRGNKGFEITIKPTL